MYKPSCARVVDFTGQRKRSVQSVSAIAWARSVLPVPGSPLTRMGRSSASAQLTAAFNDSSVKYVGVPTKRWNEGTARVDSTGTVAALSRPEAGGTRAGGA